MSAFGRLYHAEYDEHPVFDDRLAKELISGGEYENLKKYIKSGFAFFEPEMAADDNALLYVVNKHIAANPVCRAAFAESRLINFAKRGFTQYVILGAGLDTFAFRHPEFLKNGVVFEADAPATLADKTARIKRAGLSIDKNHKFVKTDFAKDDLTRTLADAGFDKSKPSFFSWLGVTYYLSREDIEKTLEAIAELSAAGSGLVFDYPDENYLGSDIPRVKKTVLMAAAGGEPMKKGMAKAEAETLLDKCGFTVKENLTPEQIQDKVTGKNRSVKAFECVNYVYAERK